MCVKRSVSLYNITVTWPKLRAQPALCQSVCNVSTELLCGVVYVSASSRLPRFRVWHQPADCLTAPLDCDWGLWVCRPAWHSDSHYRRPVHHASDDQHDTVTVTTGVPYIMHQMTSMTQWQSLQASHTSRIRWPAWHSDSHYRHSIHHASDVFTKNSGACLWVTCVSPRH